jgi:hypothetical protein
MDAGRARVVNQPPESNEVTEVSQCMCNGFGDAGSNSMAGIYMHLSAAALLLLNTRFLKGSSECVAG